MEAAGVMSERSWLVPSTILTLLLGVTALALMPDYSVVMPALGMLPLWLTVSALLAGFYAFFRMVLTGVKNPVATIVRVARDDWRALLLIAVGMAVAGLNMIAFMWTKPLLNYFVPFWADPLLARIDRALFFGNDPWRLLGWLNTMPMAIFYHRGWFALMIVTLLVVLSRPPSAQKSAIMLSYFLLWTVVGPLIHSLLPAGGPVFFQKLGYGADFAGIALPDEMVRMTNYLWAYYSGGGFGPGSGISAMPSLHIATTLWMVIAIHALARRWTWAVAIPGTVIFLLSISLGWHYAVDGIVGGAAAVACYRLCLRFYDGRPALSARTFSGPTSAAALD